MLEPDTNSAASHLPGCECAACTADLTRLDVNVDGWGGTIDGKPVWTADQIEAHLNRTAYPGTGIPGPGWSNGGFDARPASGDPTVLSFGFHSQATMNSSGYPDVPDALEDEGFSPFDVAQENAARNAIQLWNDLVSIHIIETTADKADITYGNYVNRPGTQAYAYLPYNYAYPATELAGDVWINFNQPSNHQLDNGYYGLHVLVHETGHALGLMHPGDYNASTGGGPITYPADAEYFQDSRQYTVMSYFNAEFTGGGHVDWSRLDWVYGQTPLVHDVLAIQAIYGADPATRAGATVYGFNADAGRDVFDFTLNTMPVVTIYDAGGVDTLDFSGWDTPSTINLNPGAFSSGGGSGIVPLQDLKNAGLLPSNYTQAEYDALRAAYNAPDGLLHDNISIAYGTIIENAIGGGGDDLIIGNGVDNVLLGGGGDDLLLGGAGADTLTGGDGIDTVSYLDSPAGVDVDLTRAGGQSGGHAEGDLLDGVENLSGSVFADVLVGNGGANLLDGSLGADEMRGGGGGDLYLVDHADDEVVESVGGGVDRIVSLVSYTLPNQVEEMVLAGSAAIAGVGNGLANLLFGNGAANSLNGAGGADVMRGRGGGDTYVVDNQADEAIESVGEGTDLVRSSASFVLAKHVENLILIGSGAINGTGNNSNNVITGNGAANRLSGGSGHDRLDGGGGADLMRGGKGHDRYNVDNPSDQVVEEEDQGTDTVRSTISYTLPEHVEALGLGGAGAINGTGNSLANRIYGNAKANVLDGRAGADTLQGHGGHDTYVVDHRGEKIVEQADGGVDTVRASVSFSLPANVENITLTGTAAIDATGNHLGNQLVGNSAANVLDGGRGKDLMRGRDGNDTYVVDHGAEKIIELAGEGTDRVKSSVTFTLPDHVEQLVLYGNDRINGTGNGEDNLLVGNRAPNLLRGGAGDDTLRGAGGADRLYGGLGRDVLEGGDGSDHFNFDTVLGSSNVDQIIDFLHGVDRIVLENAIFEGLGRGALSAGAFALGSAAATSAHRILYDAATHALFFDPDGVGGAAAIQFAEFADPLPTLAASDFLVI